MRTRFNWYRGFYRVWLVLSALWALSWGAIATKVTFDETQFEERVVAARASDPEAAKHGGLLLTSDADVCTDPVRAYCSVNPRPPYSTLEIDGFWLGVFAVPAVLYGILRTLAWVIRGFTRPQLQVQ